MSHRLFVYGTLKEGFRNFHINRGQRIGAEFVTALPHPLYVIGEFGLPWLLHRPGGGLFVSGQVFEVDDAVLRDMDALERVDQPGYYQRMPLQVHDAAGGSLLAVQCYFGSADTFEREPVLAGPLACYELAHQALYRYSGAVRD
jgi:gamma-glutamylaminecyclotransferase